MFILVDKPKGITSHDVINIVRKLTGERRVGHAGTLDPNATGLLIVAVGRQSTKQLWQKFGKLNKTYIADIVLGEERTTDDIEGEKKKTKSPKIRKVKYSNSEIEKVLKSFIGEQEQIPPIYSAIKISGKPAYKLARKKLEINLDARKIKIYFIKLLEYKYPLLKIETKVSSGTYIRSLARDIGKVLGCGAFLSELRRVKVGKYKVEDATTVNNLKNKKLTSKSSELASI